MGYRTIRTRIARLAVTSTVAAALTLSNVASASALDAGDAPSAQSGQEQSVEGPPENQAELSGSSIRTADQRAGDSIVKNGDFSAFSGALPDGWGRWNAAGTGSVAKVEGPNGSNAARIVTNTPTSRLALTQDVTLGAERDYLVQFDIRTTDLTAGTSYSSVGIRVDGLGTGTLPATWVETEFGTSDWTTVSGYVTFAESTKSARLHLMTDYAEGTVDFANVRMFAQEAPKTLKAATTAAGDTLITWPADVFGGADVARLELHRFDGGQAGDLSESTLLRSVTASTLKITDHDWVQGVKYTYVAAGLDASGARVWQSEPLTFTNNNKDLTQTSYVAASLTGSGTHIAWRTPAGHSGDVAILGDGEVLASGASHVGSVDVPQTLSAVSVLSGDGALLASATAASLEHPRLGLTPERVEHARMVIERDETPAEAWATLQARVDAGLASFPSTAERFAREAAFAYQITGDEAYAAAAYEGVLQAIAATPIPTPQELEAANALSSMVLAYDWCFDAWTDSEKQLVEDYFDLNVLWLQTGKHPNIILQDKASNWVGVVRGAELAYQLATRGPGEWADGRLGQLIDELDRHQWAAYSDSGMFQEGLDYLDYTQMITTPGVEGSFDQGIDALRASWHNPDVTDLILHSVALTDSKKRLQWGVGVAGDSIGFPMYLQRVPEETLAPYIDLWEKRAGHLVQPGAGGKWYSPGYLTDMFLYWPDEKPVLDAPYVPTALLDEHAGAYLFRNRVADRDDVLLGANSRNYEHLGWSGFDSFALSLISHNTLWASMPGKSQTDANGYSRLMVDGKAKQEVGNGETLASAAYEGQGGGYVHFEAGKNVGLDSAQREMVVNMAPAAVEPSQGFQGGTADAVMVVSDALADATTHDFTWQLVPEAGVDTEILEPVDGVQQWVMRNGDAWFTGWVIPADQTRTANASLSWDGKVFRASVGDSSEVSFNQVLAVGRGELPELSVDGSEVTLGGDTYDLNDLESFEPAQEEGEGSECEEGAEGCEGAGGEGTECEEGTEGCEGAGGEGSEGSGTSTPEPSLPNTGAAVTGALLAAAAFLAVGLTIRRKSRA